MYISLMLGLCVFLRMEIMVGWGGMGLGWGCKYNLPYNSLHIYPSLMLRLCVCLATEIMVGQGRVRGEMYLSLMLRLCILSC